MRRQFFSNTCATPHARTFLRRLALVGWAFCGFMTGSVAALSGTRDVSYVSTPHAVVQRMLEMVEPMPDDYLIDLGSGDGRIAIAAVRDFGVGEALGIEIDPDLVNKSRALAAEAGVADRARFSVGNLYEADYSAATVLTLYLLPTINLDIRPVILETLQPGSRVVSHAFDMREWRPDQYDSVAGSHIFMWVVPAQIDGEWALTQADGTRLQLHLRQHFQEFDGEAKTSQRQTPLTNTDLRGRRIQFAIGPDVFVGEVRDGTITPLSVEGSVQGWRAELKDSPRSEIPERETPNPKF